MAINNGSSYPRKGLTLVRRDNSLEQLVMRCPASVGADGTPIGIGSAVCLVNGIVAACTAGQDPSAAGFGVAVGVYNASGRPFTQQSTKVIASGQAGQVDVLYDPNAEFVVRCEASIGFGDMLKNVTLTGASANNSLPNIIQAVTLPASASVNDLFKFIRFAQQNDLLGASNGGLNTAAPAAGAGIIVRWNRHAFDVKTSGPNG